MPKVRGSCATGILPVPECVAMHGYAARSGMTPMDRGRLPVARPCSQQAGCRKSGSFAAAVQRLRLQARWIWQETGKLVAGKVP